MLDTSTHSSAKSFLIFVVIVLSGVLVTAVMLNTTDKTGNKQDIRSHASNEEDSLIDSDAVMAASEMEVAALDSDTDLVENSADDVADDAELAEINAL